MFYTQYSMAAIATPHVRPTRQVEEAAMHATDATYQPNLVMTLINHVSCYRKYRLPAVINGSITCAQIRLYDVTSMGEWRERKWLKGCQMGIPPVSGILIGQIMIDQSKELWVSVLPNGQPRSYRVYQLHGI